MASEKRPSVEGDTIDPRITTHAQELGIAAEKVKDVKAADQVLEYANAEAIDVPDDVNRRILQKIDWHIMPWLCGLYVLQYIDKGVHVSRVARIMVQRLTTFQALVRWCYGASERSRHHGASVLMGWKYLLRRIHVRSTHP